MADSFFGFNTQINEDEKYDSELDDLDIDEREYDALNDETFGGEDDGDLGAFDDWEVQHEQLAEIAESSKHEPNIFNDSSKISSHISSTPIKSEDNLNHSISNDEFFEKDNVNNVPTVENKPLNARSTNFAASPIPNLPKKLCTLEEIERNLLAESSNNESTKSQINNQVPVNNLASFNLLNQQQPSFQNPSTLLAGGQQSHLLQNVPNNPIAMPFPYLLLPPLQQKPSSLIGGRQLLTQPLPPHGLLPIVPPAHLLNLQNGIQISKPSTQHPIHNTAPTTVPITSNLKPSQTPPQLPLQILPSNLHKLPIEQQRLLLGLAQQTQPHLILNQKTSLPGNISIPPHFNNLNHLTSLPQFPTNIHTPVASLLSHHGNLAGNQIVNNHQLAQKSMENHHQQPPHVSNNENHQQQMSNVQILKKHTTIAELQHDNKTLSDNNNRQRLLNNKRDEYDGLMTPREKYWLMNIQLAQINTGTPYFDDYYFTVFKERIKLKNATENGSSKQYLDNRNHLQQKQMNNNNNNNRYQNNRQDVRNRNDQQNQTPTANCKIYTPTQFENSLGKLQCGSVTAPRKLIDMDIVSHDNEANVTINNQSQRDKRIKLALLDLENIYNFVLRLEDLDNPLAIMNVLKLREIREKQKIQELETANEEEKNEIIKQLQNNNLVQIDNKFDLINKILNGFLNEDKFNNYMAIRKGKLLVLRFLPYLYYDIEYLDKLIEMWIKILTSIPTIGKKDQINDNILIKYYPFFQRFIELINMDVLLNISITLTDNKKIENSRLTPISKCVLYYILSNKLGVTCVACMIERCESFYMRSAVSDKQTREWANFILNILETMTMTNVKIETPLHYLHKNVLERHLKRATVQKIKRNDVAITNDTYQKFFNVFCDKNK